MSDLAERLRAWNKSKLLAPHQMKLACGEAAEEIERLRSALATSVRAAQIEMEHSVEGDGKWRSNPVQCPESSAEIGEFEGLINTAEMREWITFVEEEMVPGRRYRIDITEVGETEAGPSNGPTLEGGG